MLIYLDTNILYNNFRMDGTYFNLINHIGTIVFSEVVIDEIKNKYREKLVEQWQKTQKELKQLSEITGKKVSMPQINVEEECRIYSDFLEFFIIESGMTVAEEYPDIPHKDVVARALRRKKPFKEDGSTGYRDYLVWRSLLNIVKLFNNEDVHFITTNIHDFSDPDDKKKLHMDLVEEMDELRIDKGRLHYWTSLKSFVEQIVKPLLEEQEENQKIIDSILEDENFREPFERSLFSYLVGTSLKGQDVFTIGNNQVVSRIEEICNIDIESISKIDDTTNLLEMKAEVFCEICSHLAKTDLKDYTREDFDGYWMEDEGIEASMVVLNTEMLLQVSVEVICDSESKKIIAFEVTEISDGNCPYCAYE